MSASDFCRLKKKRPFVHGTLFQKWFIKSLHINYQQGFFVHLLLCIQPIKHHRDITISHICNLLRFQAIVNVVLSSGCVGPNIKFSLCYGLLLKHLKSSEIHWLHPDLTVSELTQRYEQQHLEAEWRSVLVYIHTQSCV